MECLCYLQEVSMSSIRGEEFLTGADVAVKGLNEVPGGDGVVLGGW